MHYLFVLFFRFYYKNQKHIYQVYLRMGLIPEIVLVAIVNIFTQHPAKVILLRIPF